MTFHISSALASQTASKTAALEILQKLGKRPANLTDNQFLKHHQRTTIEHWWSGVKVVIQPFWESGKHVIEATFHKGISTILSWKHFAWRLWERAGDKAFCLKTRRISETRIKVEGTQAPDGWWTVTATGQGLECNCYLYRCEYNRLVRDGECQPLLNAIGSNQAQIKELFDEDTNQLVRSVQICCHHIKAAMWNEFDVESIADYLLNYREITSAWQQRHRDWGKLNFNIKAPKPELPTGSYLQRTDDWMCLEYRVWIHCKKTRLVPGEIPWTAKCIGRMVDEGHGFSAYRPRSGMGQVFANKYDATTYLIKNAGYTLEQVAEAYQLKQSA
jgi:hypothetical protein